MGRSTGRDAGLGALAVLLGLAPLTPTAPSTRAAVADDDQAVGGISGTAHELANGPEEGTPLVLHQGELIAVAVPHGGSDRLGLGDLRAERRRAVHAGQRLQEPALVDDGDGDGESRTRARGPGPR